MQGLVQAGPVVTVVTLLIGLDPGYPACFEFDSPSGFNLSKGIDNLSVMDC